MCYKWFWWPIVSPDEMLRTYIHQSVQGTYVYVTVEPNAEGYVGNNIVYMYSLSLVVLACVDKGVWTWIFLICTRWFG